MTEPVSAVLRPGWPVDVRLTLSALRMGRADPCHRLSADGAVWRTGLMATGPVTYRVVNDGSLYAVRADAWGPGAVEMMDGLADLLGGRDRPETFRADHPRLRSAERRLAGLRVPRTGLVFEALVPAVLHQKIQGRDASHSWGWLVRRHGTPAPAPAPAEAAGMTVPPAMMVPPDPGVWAAIPQWDWRRAGVEPFAIRVVRRAAERAARLDRLASERPDDPGAVYTVLRSIPGVGPWTAAEVGHRALGDADALSVGDYHLAALTGWALAGRDMGDEEAEAYLERWRPHRYRVMRLLELTPEAWPPRRGPRLSRPQHRHGEC